MSARAPDWLTARPITHRGLHDAARGRIENSIGAARAAIEGGYAIECDVQKTRDGDLVVFHDETLDRLTALEGRVDTQDAASLARIALKGTDETIPTFDAFLAAVAGRTPLVVEIKSDFDGDMTAARRAAQCLASYAGPAVIESFDPEPMAFLRREAGALGIAHIPLGIVGMADYGPQEWPSLSPAQRAEMTHFLHYPRTRPEFISWNVADLPHAIPYLSRAALGVPVTSWTVRSAAQATIAREWVDQIVFEGFTPDA